MRGLVQSVLIETSSQTVLGLSALPGAAEWERFYFYAKRVRKLICDDPYGEHEPDGLDLRHNTSPRFFWQLLMSRPPTTLLPNLQKLVWFYDRKHTF